MVAGRKRPTIVHFELVLKGRPRRDDEVKSSMQALQKDHTEVST
jgi:hypothetical protein